jgi:hypothetical protein
MSKETCWAAVLGTCGGGPSGEHVITDGLVGKRVQLSGHLSPWLEADFVEVPAHRLKANILCADHNRFLGKHADRPAIRFQRALRRSHDPMRLRGSAILRPPAPFDVSGTGLAKWLCKTHCNLMVVRGMAPDPDYVRYAFGQTTDKKLYFYAAQQTGESVKFTNPAEPVVHHGRLHLREMPEFDAFVIGLSGFEWAVGPVPLARTTGPMLDRPRGLHWPTPLGPYRINLAWDNEPTYDLSVDSMPKNIEPDLRVVRPDETLRVNEPE